MLTLVMALAVSQITAENQFCSLRAGHFDMFVILDDKRQAASRAFKVTCLQKDLSCTGAFLDLTSVNRQHGKVTFADVGQLAPMVMRLPKGSLLVLEQGVYQFAIDLAEGRVVRTSTQGERAEGKCAPQITP